MQQVELSVSFVLRATWSDIRYTLLHEIAHAIVGPGHGHEPCGKRPRGERCLLGPWTTTQLAGWWRSG